MFSFSLKGQHLEDVNTAKYLGVDLSSNIMEQPHWSNGQENKQHAVISTKGPTQWL